MAWKRWWLRSMCIANTLLRSCCPLIRKYIELNLATGCARGLQLIAMHQLLLNMQLDRIMIDQLVEADCAGTDQAQGADSHRDDERRPPADG